METEVASLGDFCLGLRKDLLTPERVLGRARCRQKGPLPSLQTFSWALGVISTSPSQAALFLLRTKLLFSGRTDRYKKAARPARA